MEPLHNHVHATSTTINNSNNNSAGNQDQIENAVIKQELMAAKEDIADLKAKIYVSDKEKTGKTYHSMLSEFIIRLENSHTRP